MDLFVWGIAQIFSHIHDLTKIWLHINLQVFRQDPAHLHLFIGVPKEATSSVHGVRGFTAESPRPGFGSSTWPCVLLVRTLKGTKKVFSKRAGWRVCWGCQNTEMIISSFWRLKVQDQGVGRICFWGLSFWLVDDHLLPMSLLFLSSMYVCIVISSYKETSQSGIGPT